MQIPNNLRQLAATAFTEATTWPAFLAEHADTIRRCEPYDRGRYHRLVELVRSVVVSGTTSGLFACGDDDAGCEWFADDEPAAVQTSMFDTSEAYR